MTPSHGGLNYSQLLKEGIRPQDVKDFSVSINPAGMPQSVRDAIDATPFDRYPDSDSTELRQSLSKLLGPSPEEFFVTNGTSQAVYLISQALIGPKGSWGQAGPTYSEYGDASKLQSTRKVEIRAREEDLFYPPVQEIIDQLREYKPSIFWFCSPNNPTGVMLKEEDFHSIRKACLRSGTHFILDEAYRCFVAPEEQYDTFHPGVINLRSMTKDYGIPSLRLGYFRASPEIIEQIRPYRPEWSVSLPAQRSGCASIKEQDYFEKSWQRAIELTRDFRAMLEKEGFQLFPSSSNFFLIKLHNLKELKAFLWKDRILVRDCSSFGMKDIIRVGTRCAKDNKLLVERLVEYRKSHPPLT